MFRRLRFVRYAMAFERAFKSDDWSEVQTHFHPEATYEVIGSGTEWDGVVKYPQAITRFMKRMLDSLDRRFQSRSPGLDGMPRMKDGVFELPWKARYVSQAGQMTLHGVSRCTFKEGRILALSDTMDADECRQWGALIGVMPASARA